MIVALSAAHQRFTVPELQHLDAALPGLRDHVAASRDIEGFVVLATCHRVEVYLEAPDVTVAERLVAELEASGVSELPARLERFTDGAAAEHLFLVACGLKSMVVGENEIAGQVKAALGNAQDAGTISPSLYRLFRSAMRTAKLVAATELGAAGRSFVGAALGDATPQRALVIGTGAFARVAVKQLSLRGCGRIAVFSPSGRQDEFAASRDVVPLRRDCLTSELAATDLVLGCSGQGEPTVTFGLVAEALAQRDRELRIIDLALRPDVDPAVATLPGVAFGDLATVTGGASVDDAQARSIVADALVDYLAGEQEQDGTQAVRVVRERVQTIAERELERARRRLGDLTAQQAAQVELLVHRIAQGVLHQPTMRARECARDGRVDDFEAALTLVFGTEQHGH